MFHTNDINPIALRQPHIGQRVIAVTTRYRLPAFRNSADEWHTWVGEKVLDAEVIGWIEIPPTPYLCSPEAMDPTRADG